MLLRHLSTSLLVQRKHLQILLGLVSQERLPFLCPLEASIPAFVQEHGGGRISPSHAADGLCLWSHCWHVMDLHIQIT